MTVKKLTLAWLFITFIATAQTINAQEVSLPTTPAGKMAKAYFEAFNSEDPEQMRVFTANNRTKNALERVPLETRMGQFSQLKRMFGTLELKQISESKELQLTTLAFSPKMEAWFEIGFILNEENPPLLESFQLKPSAGPASEMKTDLYGEWKDLPDLLTNAVAKHEIPGISMTVIKNGEIKETAVAGIREIGSPDKVEANDRFHIGSITKSMTATLIGRLVEQGKLSASTSLKEIFPNMRMKAVYESITIDQLLNHRSGVKSYATVTDEEEAVLLGLPGSPSQQRLAFAKRVLNEEPLFEPGKSFTYSNAGYSILGTITEKITGVSWEDQLEQHVFGPLSMETAGLGWPKTDSRADQPEGHLGALGDLEIQNSKEYILGPYIDPAGDVHASSKDLAKFALDHLKGLNGLGALLSQGTYQWLHGNDADMGYFAGWILKKENEKLVHEHGGSAGTFVALMQIIPESNDGYVIVANAGDIALDAVFRNIISTYQSR